MALSLPSPRPGVVPRGSLTALPQDRRQAGARDLAYAAALADAADRMGAAVDTGQLWSLVVEEAVTLIEAAGTALVERRDTAWHLLAARFHDPAVAPARIAAGVDTLARRGLLTGPGVIEDLGAGTAPAGWRALLVTGLDRRPSRAATRLLWFANGPGTFAGYGDVADLLSRHAGAAARVVATQESLNRAVAARQLVGQAVGILMTRRRLTAEHAFALLRDRSQHTNTRVRVLAEQVIWTGDLPTEDSRD